MQRGGIGIMGRSVSSVGKLLGCGLMSAVAVVAVAAVPPPSRPSALGAVKPGMWRIRSLDAGGPPDRRMCVLDPAVLMQIRHGAASCTRFIIADAARETTVHYSCRGAGWGRTSLRLAGEDEIEIETQGIANNSPFAFKAEGTRSGPCAAHADSRR